MNTQAEDKVPQVGPAMDDEGGELTPRLTCRGCFFLRVVDFHYHYCAALTVPGSNVIAGGKTQINTYPRPLEQCPYMEPEATTV